MGLAIALLFGGSIALFVLTRNRRMACRVNLRIVELSDRLAKIDSKALSAEQADVLRSAKGYLDTARKQYERGDFVGVDQSLSLGHLNAHSVENPSDAHGFKH